MTKQEDRYKVMNILEVGNFEGARLKAREFGLSEENLKHDAITLVRKLLYSDSHTHNSPLEDYLCADHIIKEFDIKEEKRNLGRKILQEAFSILKSGFPGAMLLPFYDIYTYEDIIEKYDLSMGDIKKAAGFAMDQIEEISRSKHGGFDVSNYLNLIKRDLEDLLPLGKLKVKRKVLSTRWFKILLDSK